MPVLCDINFLFSLTYGGHEHHELAVGRAEATNQSGELRICRVAQTGLLRLLNNPSVMGGDVLSGAECWRVYDVLIGDGRFEFAGEPFGFEETFRDLTESFPGNPKLWPDAHLAAIALCENWRVLTFDGGFRNFKEIEIEVLA